ncbi:MAG: TOBE domain-containing protein, partial [Pseudomonas sp.]|nr:TOBE domain-containing protein [Pseudomonas sp.]
ELAIGEPVDWFIPETGILLMPLNERPGTALDNPVEVIVESILLLGDECRVTLKAGDSELAMRVPQHVAQRYALAAGQRLQVRLRGETIHAMPRQSG